MSTGTDVVRPFKGDEPCTQTSPEVFFPSPTQRHRVRLAAELCSFCAIRVKCLEYGLALNLEGVWGGQLLAGGAGRSVVDQYFHEGTPQRYMEHGCRCDSCREAYTAWRADCRENPRRSFPLLDVPEWARDGHRRFNRGERTDSVMSGEREYQRVKSNVARKRERDRKRSA